MRSGWSHGRAAEASFAVVRAARGAVDTRVVRADPRSAMEGQLSRARALCARHGVFDAHVDSLQRQLDLGHDLGTRTAGHLDLVRGKEGGLASVVLVNWVDPKHIAKGPGAALARTRALLGEFHALLAAHPDQLAWGGNGELRAAARARGLVAGIPGIEGGHSIEGELDNLHALHAHGVRVLTLVWNNHLPWIRSCQPNPPAGTPEGLSDFGRQVVREMNQLGMLVDLSHAGERSYYDALEASSAPVIASHSGCKAIHGHQRNLDDDQLRALARNGGVVGIVFCTAFLKDEAQKEDARLREDPRYKAIAGDNDTEVFLRQGEFLQEHAAPLPLDVVVQHLEHAVEVAGVDHVGLGSDYDGIGRTPQGLEDASCYANLAARLLERGWSEEHVAKVMGGNLERVHARATGPGTRSATARLEPLRA
jgi:membrane dipeptidase